MLHLSKVNNIRNSALIIAFGIHIIKLRKEKGLTMEKLAELADIDYRQIAYIEKGETNVTISTIYALSNALELPMEDLLKFDIPDSK